MRPGQLCKDHEASEVFSKVPAVQLARVQGCLAVSRQSVLRLTDQLLQPVRHGAAGGLDPDPAALLLPYLLLPAHWQHSLIVTI